MRLVFAGTPEFARHALTALSQAGHDIVLVLTQPDRAAGRGLSVSVSPVKQEALRLGLPVLQPESLKAEKSGAEQTKNELRRLQPDLMVVAAYGLLLPKDVLEIPRFGCLNIHASLLPRWRGAAPIQRALAEGDSHTGVALMQMEEGLDTGPVWAQQSTPITTEDNFQSLHDRLAAMGAALLVRHLSDFPRPGTHPEPQLPQGVTYAHKVSKSDALIDWSRSAQEVANRIRAFDPAPGAQTSFDHETLKVFGAIALVNPLKNTSPGQIIQADRSGFLVSCGEGAVSLAALQRSGGKRLGFREFLNGKKVVPGQCFGI